MSALLAVLLLFSMPVGFNWTPGSAPAGETPTTALQRMHGQLYRDYGDPFQGNEGIERLRLVRYNRFSPQQQCGKGATYQAHGRCPEQIRAFVATVPGRLWQLGNEINLLSQDGGARDPTEAVTFASWYRVIYGAIKTGDPTARIVGPSVWNWDGAGSVCCVRGMDSAAWFFSAYQTAYGTAPPMDYAALHIYPWSPSAWADPAGAGVTVELSQLDGARAWYGDRAIAVTEWGMLRKQPGTCALLPQSDADRYTFVASMLQGMQSRGVAFALHYGSHEQPCDGDGLMSWLINRDGTLTPEGQAHAASK